MGNQLLTKFLEQSESVGNNHIFCTIAEIKSLVAAGKFEYADLHSFQIFNEAEITQRGISNAIVEANYGIAETGTLVVESTDEKKRMATCLCEDLHVILDKNKIVDRLENIAEFLEENTSSNQSYISFITGASRTADIERELTIGVHGPRSLTLYIIEDLQGAE